MSRQITRERYGWIKDKPDFRDIMYAIPRHISIANLPTKLDLTVSGFMPGIYDQGQVGSCTANAWGALAQYVANKLKLKDHANPSRLFIYWNERWINGQTGQDAGAELRDGAKVLAKNGWPDETLWPYDISKLTVKPSPESYKAALPNKAKSYNSLTQDANTIKSCLASGFPVVFGFTVYTSFESNQVASTGVVPMPKRSEQVLGGHAVMLSGYDDSKQMFFVRNSWGVDWGVHGYFWMPYQYVLDASLASDFWTLHNEG